MTAPSDDLLPGLMCLRPAFVTYGCSHVNCPRESLPCERKTTISLVNTYNTHAALADLSVQAKPYLESPESHVQGQAQAKQLLVAEISQKGTPEKLEMTAAAPVRAGGT